MSRRTDITLTRKILATPVPQVADLAALNRALRARCLGEADRTVDGRAEPIGQRFARDRAEALALPAHPFDACVMQAAQVDKYQTVPFDNNCTSVPRSCAYWAVTVKGYLGHVEVGAGGQVEARHARHYGHDEQILDPLHYRPRWDAGPQRWTTRPFCGTGNCPSPSRGCARLWRAATGRGPGRGSVYACCNCWPNTRAGGCSKPWRVAYVRLRFRPSGSSPCDRCRGARAPACSQRAHAGSDIYLSLNRDAPMSV